MNNLPLGNYPTTVKILLLVVFPFLLLIKKGLSLISLKVNAVKRFNRLLLLLSLWCTTSFSVFAANEIMSSGSLIIDMGHSPQTIANSLKPYGAIYDLLRNYQVPIKWVIGQGKSKDGNDFIYNSRAFKGGTFIIQKEYITPAVQARITYWAGQGVDFVTTTSPFTVDVTETIISAPRWALNSQNGSIAEKFINNAGINNTLFPNSYYFKDPQLLNNCDDIFVMPHADPTWATHSNLYFWNQTYKGAIWVGCKSGSTLSNSINPSNSSQQMNFLSTRNSITTPTPWPQNSLINAGNHKDGSIPYVNTNFSDPIAQYLGSIDAAQQSGAEQIYIPLQSTNTGGATRWNPGAKIIVYDPTQENVPNPDYANGNVAATLVYGRGFDDPNRGYVMFEGSHDISGSAPANVAAQRAFLNFSFFANKEKAPQVTTSGITAGQVLTSSSNYNLNVTANSVIPGSSYTYQWSSSCGGTFSNSTTNNPTYTAPVVTENTPCVITVKVTDNCGRVSFVSVPITIIPAPRRPIAADDFGSISSQCNTNNTISDSCFK